MLVRRTLPFLGPALALAVATPGLGAEEIQIEDAVRIALERNAELASLAADVSAARARLGSTTLLAQRNTEVSVGGVEGRAGDVEVEVVQELEVGAQRVHAQRALEAAERRISQEVGLPLARLEAARDAARAFEADVVRAIEENLRLVATAYQTGKIGLFELRRDALDARRDRIRAQEDLASAEAQLLRARGQEGPSR